MTIQEAIAKFGAAAKEKLNNAAAQGQPEDQLRAPFETLLEDVSLIARYPPRHTVAVGESALRDLKTRPDYAVSVGNALAGFVELKAPGKGADPRSFTDKHDIEQWKSLRSLPNLLYTDGNQFSLWHNGELDGHVVALEGDIATSGRKLASMPGLMRLFEAFLGWQPTAPRSARDLAHTAARLCRLLRDEVTEQMDRHSEGLTMLAADWRNLLFPDATNERFADGYAQAVTFGLLSARARNISLQGGLDHVAVELSRGSSLIGEALKLLTGNDENQRALNTSLTTLTRVLEAVQWGAISRGQPDAWLYFYEEFLDIYDRNLRKQTGSYYTPPEVVEAMAGLVDQALKSPRFGKHAGLASPAVTLADPAMGTGTFLLGVLRRIAANVSAEQGPGAVAGAIEAALQRLVAFEIQLGPYAVAQLRILAEVVELCDGPPATSPQLFVTDTLGDPQDAGGYFSSMLPAISRSRREANRIKESEPIMVVLGNPPYKEKAKGRGGWVEQASKNAKQPAPLAAWFPPPELGAHAKHLRNLYVYFWRWATWKVFDHGDGKTPGPHNGIVCFITVAGFLNGPGFATMRSYLRELCDDIWVVDCTPEGHQPPVNSRIFQDVQQPVCIVLAARAERAAARKPSGATGRVQYRALPSGRREEKFVALGQVQLDGDGWVECSSTPAAPFLPAATGAWSTFIPLDEFFVYNGSGAMPGRTWVVAPDVWSLERRWQELVNADAARKKVLFHPHMRNGEPGDKHVGKLVTRPLYGFPELSKTVAEETGTVPPPVRYAFRSFDLQWIIPDARLINQPNPELWRTHSGAQLFATAITRSSPVSGPALTFTSQIPDLDHYKGNFGGRVFPLWQNAEASEPNLRLRLLAFLAQHYGAPVAPEELFAYMAGHSRAPRLHHYLPERPHHARTAHPTHSRPRALHASRRSGPSTPLAAYLRRTHEQPPPGRRAAGTAAATARRSAALHPKRRSNLHQAGRHAQYAGI